jgi:uncharacterized protein YpbB
MSLMHQILERLHDPEPLRPLALFGINRSNFLTVESTMITYVIVLMQFKLTDIQVPVLPKENK